MTHKTRRRGAAILFVAVCMAVLAVMMAAVVRNGFEQKRFLVRRENQTQAYWLAQAGIEHAAARLLADPQDYTGEKLELIPQSEVRIAVETRKDSPGTFLITSVGTYPSGDVSPVTISASRTFQLKRDKGKSFLDAAR
jgi:type II secretory pathway pseudopilin PulG